MYPARTACCTELSSRGSSLRCGGSRRLRSGTPLADSVFACFPLRARPRDSVLADPKVVEGKNERAWSEKICAPCIALRDILVVSLQAGLRACERVSPDLRLPVPLHSGVMQILDSFTVAGAAPDWFHSGTHRLPVSPRGWITHGEPEALLKMRRVYAAGGKLSKPCITTPKAAGVPTVPVRTAR